MTAFQAPWIYCDGCGIGWSGGQKGSVRTARAVAASYGWTHVKEPVAVGGAYKRDYCATCSQMRGRIKKKQRRTNK